jgi:hypothetical protein
MKRILIAVALVMLLDAVALQSQTPAPKPGPEQKKMQLLAGDWTYEREYKANPLRAAGKYTGKYSSREILNGFFVEYQHTMKGPQGDIHWFEINGYDPVAKTNIYNWYGDSGGMGRGTFTISGNDGTWEGTSVMSGIQYRERGSFSLSADGTSFTKKAEVSPDGKTWIPYSEMKGTRMKAPSK